MASNISLDSIRKQAQKDIKESKDLKDLNGVFKRYLGKQGQLTLVLHSLGNLPQTERAKMGKAVNELKNFLKVSFDKKSSEVKQKVQKEAGEKEWIDITVPGKKPAFGHLHPLTITRRRIEEIFQTMGFTVAEGLEMESSQYNFDNLNIPKDHPARDMWDTFWLKNGLLLRTHTSPAQIRYMEKNNPPLRIIVPGTVFRHEATDSSHEFQLTQVEGLMVDKSISVAHLKAVIKEFFRNFFKKDIGFRLRPDYFPFTEPSFDISISCLVCGGKGLSGLQKTGWMEVAGAGMVHPDVFKNSGLISGEWQGWAFGFGLERLTMLKYKIGDVRLFRSGDLKFLKQF